MFAIPRKYRRCIRIQVQSSSRIRFLRIRRSAGNTPKGRPMIHEHFASSDLLIETEQWCTRGLAQDHHSLLEKTSPPSTSLDLIQLVSASVLEGGGFRRTQPRAWMELNASFRSISVARLCATRSCSTAHFESHFCIKMCRSYSSEQLSS